MPETFRFELRCNGVAIDTWEGDIPYADVGALARGRKTTRYALQPGDILTVWCVEAPARYENDPWFVDHVRIRVTGGGIIGP
jgi:hypothetical protein